jgi:PAS domain S-box-containing protein
MRVELFSAYPFPNRDKRVLDEFQKESLRSILEHPNEPYAREDFVDGRLMFRAAFADFMSEKACVECHNTHPNTPKNNWKLGDARGVIEVTLPLSISEKSGQTLTTNIILFILLNFIILTIYYFLVSFFKNKKLQNTHTNLQEKYSYKNKLLSEYKRAVDLGAIVSKADKRGKITYVNDAFIEISGYGEDELLGKSHSIVKHEDTPKEVFKDLWKTILSKNVWQGDIKNRAKDGRIYYVFATIVPILNDKDEIEEFLSIRYDTTNLHIAIAEANRAEKSKGRFLANMSHELRTPLNAIIGFSQILLRRDTLDDKNKEYVKKIKLSGDNLLSLVNSILDFSKMDENEMLAYPSEVEIKELFSEVLVMCEAQMLEKSITLNMFEIAQDATIYADKQLLKQAFINIISNAVKFSKESGAIELTHKMQDSSHIFGVCDYGDGMDKEDVETLFTPFKQGKNAQTNVIKGTGLGLAITHKIITELHKGEIWVESELGSGTCFYIKL